MGLGAQAEIGNRVERPHQAHAAEVIGGGRAGAARAGGLGHAAVAAREGIAGLEHDLAREFSGIVASDLRQGAVGDRDQHDLAESGGLARVGRPDARTEPPGQALEFGGVARGQHQFVTGGGPEFAQGAADLAGADDADAQRPLALGLRRCRAQAQ